VTKTAEAPALLSALAAVSALAAASGTTIDTFDHITSNFNNNNFKLYSRDFRRLGNND
jgi:hypothetical protein